MTLVAQNSFGTGFGGADIGDTFTSSGIPQDRLHIRTGDGNDRVTLIAENIVNDIPVEGFGGTGFSMNVDIGTGRRQRSPAVRSQ